MTNTITADTITDDQIRHLRDEALDAGDDIQAAYCTLALGMTPTIALSTTVYGARIECARVINSARDAALEANS